MYEEIFLTGASGFLGTHLLYRLLLHNPKKVFVLVRSGSKAEAKDKLLAGLLKYFDYYKINFSKNFFDSVTPIQGDVSFSNMGMSRAEYASLAKKVNIVIHAAAICNFDVSLDIARKINVKGTREVAKFAEACFKNGRLQSMNYISTVGVAGKHPGIFFEHQLDIGQRFNNYYEQSKFEAEKLLCEFREKKIPVNIFRPGLITGDSKTGYTTNFKMFYEPLRFFSMEIFDSIPALGGSKYSLVPVDYCAETIMAIILRYRNEFSTYNILGRGTLSLETIIDLASDFFNFKKPKLIPLEKFSFETVSAVKQRILKSYVPYFNYKVSFDQSRAEYVKNKLKIKSFDIDKNFFKLLLLYCKKIGFISS